MCRKPRYYATRKKTRQLQFLFASTPTVDLGDGNIGISPLSMAASCAKWAMFNPLNRGLLQPRSAGRFETPLGLQMVGSLGDSSGLEGAMWSVPGGSIMIHIPQTYSPADRKLFGATYRVPHEFPKLSRWSLGRLTKFRSAKDLLYAYSAEHQVLFSMVCDQAMLASLL